MNNDIEWKQDLANIRKEIESIERKTAQMHKEKAVLMYMVSHPNSGKYEDLIELNGDEVLGKAILKYRTGILNDCSTYNELKSCNILDCLYCDNSVYEIMLESGNGIKKGERDIESYSSKHLKVNDCDHEILFYDLIPNEEELFSYLLDEDSRFKIIRKSDNKEIINTAEKIRPSNKIKKLK